MKNHHKETRVEHHHSENISNDSFDALTYYLRSVDLLLIYLASRNIVTLCSLGWNRGGGRQWQRKKNRRKRETDFLRKDILTKDIYCQKQVAIMTSKLKTEVAVCRFSSKWMFLKISQYPQENNYVRFSF